MRIAVPTNDGVSVSGHFGRSEAFLVFEVGDGRILGREVRSNTAQHAHAQGSCGEGEGSHEPHSHAGILSLLSACDVVICAGMGSRAAQALKESGITPIVADLRGSPEEVVGAYLKGDLNTAREGFCQCSHHGEQS